MQQFNHDDQQERPEIPPVTAPVGTNERRQVEERVVSIRTQWRGNTSEETLHAYRETARKYRERTADSRSKRLIKKRRQPATPPLSIRNLLLVLLVIGRRRYWLDCLDLEFEQIAERHGLEAAQRWYRKQVLTSALPFLKVSGVALLGLLFTMAKEWLIKVVTGK